MIICPRGLVFSVLVSGLTEASENDYVNNDSIIDVVYNANDGSHFWYDIQENEDDSGTEWLASYKIKNSLSGWKYRVRKVGGAYDGDWVDNEQTGTGGEIFVCWTDPDELYDLELVRYGRVCTPQSPGNFRTTAAGPFAVPAETVVNWFWAGLSFNKESWAYNAGTLRNVSIAFTFERLRPNSPGDISTCGGTLSTTLQEPTGLTTQFNINAPSGIAGLGFTYNSSVTASYDIYSGMTSPNSGATWVGFRWKKQQELEWGYYTVTGVYSNAWTNVTSAINHNLVKVTVQPNEDVVGYAGTVCLQSCSEF